MCNAYKYRFRVTPYAGVWIEINGNSWVDTGINVTPYAGVWIEIRFHSHPRYIPNVTPYAGVWIEMKQNRLKVGQILSLPTRECGLKSVLILMGASLVASLPTRECGLK